MKAAYTEEEAFAILFPDERSRQEYREKLSRMDRNLVDNIRAGKINPIRGLAGPERNGSEDHGRADGYQPAEFVPHGESRCAAPDSGYPKKNRLRAGRLHR